MRNRKRFRRSLHSLNPLRSAPAGIIPATSTGLAREARPPPQDCVPRSPPIARDDGIEIETLEGVEGRRAWDGTEAGRVPEGRQACPMSVANNKIITVQKMGCATVEAKH